MTVVLRVLRLIQDPEPDERGNLLVAAVVGNGRIIALELNAN